MPRYRRGEDGRTGEYVSRTAPGDRRPTGASWSSELCERSYSRDLPSLVGAVRKHRTFDMKNSESASQVRSIEQLLACVDHLMTADEVATMLSIPRNGVYALRDSGQLPAIKLHRHYRWDPATVSLFVRDSTSSSDEE